MPAAPADVRQHILDVAKPIMLGKGFAAVGLNEILQAAAVPKGSFYHYFESKDSFGEALLDAYFAGYLDQVDAVLSQGGGSAAERLMLYWARWRETQANDDPQCKCLAVKLGAEVSDQSEAMRAALLRGTDRLVDRLTRAVAEAIADGSVDSTIAPHATAVTLYQLWLGASLLAKITRTGQPFDAAIAATRRILSLPDQPA